MKIIFFLCFSMKFRIIAILITYAMQVLSFVFLDLLLCSLCMITYIVGILYYGIFEKVFSCNIIISQCERHVLRNLKFWIVLKLISHGSCVYILYTKIGQDVYNWCIQKVYKMYAQVCWNVGYILYTNI